VRGKGLSLLPAYRLACIAVFFECLSREGDRLFAVLPRRLDREDVSIPEVEDVGRFVTGERGEVESEFVSGDITIPSLLVPPAGLRASVPRPVLR
jgi:hypothetical protein